MQARAVEDVTRTLDLKLSALEIKQILGVVSWTEETAAKVLKKIHKLKGEKLTQLLGYLGTTEENLADFGYFPSGKAGVWLEYETDSDLRDTEHHLLDRSGYTQGNPKDFDPSFAIDTAKLWQFLETTQPEELEKLRDQPNWQRLILERIDRKIKKDGLLSVLKKGISINDAELTLYYSHPYNDLNPEIAANFAKNIFSLTRQVHFSTENPTHSIDLVIFLNGLPIITIELKNPWTNQTAYHAKKQYGERDPKETLFNFARCLVHFAADTDEIWMTTRLTGKNTYFLPFNKGNTHGKGNPINPNGHKTSYLWEDVLSRRSLAHILEHFVLLEGKPKDALKDKTLIFPRYHQRDVVNQLLNDAQHHGTGKTYLIQHSAGSGKSNSITWLAFQLIQSSF